MIAYIKGQFEGQDADGIIIDHQGVGLYIYFSQPVAWSQGQTVKIYTYLAVREDDLSLYGFLSPLDRDLFLDLISVKGIGPKVASGCFKKATSQDLRRAISEKDLAFLKTLPGIGHKTAQQILLDLKNKLVDPKETAVSSGVDMALSGLKNLGYKPAQLNAIRQALVDHGGQDVGQLIKLGLSLLSK